jgi:hypothetical protein
MRGVRRKAAMAKICKLGDDFAQCTMCILDDDTIVIASKSAIYRVIGGELLLWADTHENEEPINFVFNNAIAAYHNGLLFSDGYGTTLYFISQEAVLDEESQKVVYKIKRVAGGSEFGGIRDGDCTGSASGATFSHISGIAVHADDRIVLIEQFRVREISADQLGVVTLAGDIELAEDAKLRSLTGIAVLSDGSLVVVDGRRCIQRIGTDGSITLVAGDKTTDSFNMIDGIGEMAKFMEISTICIDSAGYALVCEDRIGGLVRRVNVDTGEVKSLPGVTTNPIALTKDGKIISNQLTEGGSPGWLVYNDIVDVPSVQFSTSTAREAIRTILTVAVRARKNQTVDNTAWICDSRVPELPRDLWFEIARQVGTPYLGGVEPFMQQPVVVGPHYGLEPIQDSESRIRAILATFHSDSPATPKL